MGLLSRILRRNRQPTNRHPYTPETVAKNEVLRQKKIEVGMKKQEYEERRIDREEELLDLQYDAKLAKLQGDIARYKTRAIEYSSYDDDDDYDDDEDDDDDGGAAEDPLLTAIKMFASPQGAAVGVGAPPSVGELIGVDSSEQKRTPPPSPKKQAWQEIVDKTPEKIKEMMKAGHIDKSVAWALAREEIETGGGTRADFNKAWKNITG